MGALSATIFGCAGPVLGAEEAAFFAATQPVGFILFARNVDNPAQLNRLTADLRSAVGRDAPVLVDQEGGRVQRLRAPNWREWMAPLDQVAAAGENAARAMYLRSFLIGREHLDCGIDGNCAPLADIARAETHPFLRNRLYGQHLETVVEIARAVADGLRDAGVFPVLKHIPGHGLGTLDSHHDLPRVTASGAALKALDFAAFRALKDIKWGMTAHLVFEAIDPDLPATLSPAMIALIREEIGFQGVLMTDDLSMNALPGPVTERAAQARAAGCDVALHCNGDLAEMRAVADAAGRLGAAGQARVAAAMVRPAPATLDIATAEAEFDAL
jgi:beta-N-acetylhexosaminidase